MEEIAPSLSPDLGTPFCQSTALWLSYLQPWAQISQHPVVNLLICYTTFLPAVMMVVYNVTLRINKILPVAQIYSHNINGQNCNNHQIYQILPCTFVIWKQKFGIQKPHRCRTFYNMYLRQFRITAKILQHVEKDRLPNFKQHL